MPLKTDGKLVFGPLDFVYKNIYLQNFFLMGVGINLVYVRQSVWREIVRYSVAEGSSVIADIVIYLILTNWLKQVFF